jgi:hypothetical protein
MGHGYVGADSPLSGLSPYMYPDLINRHVFSDAKRNHTIREVKALHAGGSPISLRSPNDAICVQLGANGHRDCLHDPQPVSLRIVNFSDDHRKNHDLATAEEAQRVLLAPEIGCAFVQADRSKRGKRD